MKGLLKSRLVLLLIMLVLLAGAIVVPLSGAIRHSHAANPTLFSYSATANSVLPNVQASPASDTKPVNEDPIAANPNNPQQLLTGGNDYNCGQRPGAGFYTSNDSGRTFPNHTCIQSLSLETSCGDPGVGYDLHNVAYIIDLDALPVVGCDQSAWFGSGLPNAVAIEHSTDNGKSWSAPTQAVSPTFLSGFIDKPWLQIDGNPTSPHANTLYISTTQFCNTFVAFSCGTAGSPQKSVITVSHLSPGSTNWITTRVNSPQAAPQLNQWSDIAIGRNGKVYVSWVHCTIDTSTNECAGQATFSLSTSNDGGNTWSKPTTIATVQLAPGSSLPNTQQKVIDFPVIGVDNSTGPYAGSLYAAFYNWTGSHMQVEVATLKPGGGAWGSPVPVTPASISYDQFFPWLSVGKGGVVGVTWLDRRNDPNNLTYQTFGTISIDEGISFASNIQIATASSNPNNDGKGGKFMGDYTGNVWAGTNLMASWMDSRNKTNMQDYVGGIAFGFGPFLTVNTTADIAPPCSTKAYSLRCAINQANTDSMGDTISFDIPSSDSGCKLTTINGRNVYVCTITPPSGLPQLLASHTTINGYSQPGARKNTLSIGKGDNAIITIRIDGSKTGGGLVLNNSASYDIIRGLEITNFNPYGILLNTSANTNNTITGNFIGTDGKIALGNGLGIYIGGGSKNNTVGGQTPDTVNLISGNSGQGIVIGAGSGNTIEGNYIGTDTSGTSALRKGTGVPVPNPLSSSGIPNNTGISVFANASGNLIGGITPASANIIAHNTYGIATDNSSNTNIIGNKINSNFVGVFAENGETGDSISENTITNNTTVGILVGNSSTDHVHVFMLANMIFTNGGFGIDLYPGGTVNCSGPTSGAPNDYTPCPVIQTATTSQVSGTACAGCRVEVYIATNETDDQGHGEGKTFVNSVNADSSGHWNMNVSLSVGTWVTATATTPSSPGPEETSEFAANVMVSNSIASGNLWITGHDPDYHCSQGNPSPGAGCHYLQVAVNFVMHGSTLPLLALDHGSEVATAIANAFGSGAPTVDTVDPRTGFASLPLLDSSGKPLYSAIIVASDITCGGCDNNDGAGVTPDSDAINARAADIAQFFNAGGGILALAGADNYDVFYNFLPVAATGATTTSPYTLTSLGLSLGLVEGQDDNCCETHNSFQLPASGSQFQVAETDAAGLAETMVVQNGTAVSWTRPTHSSQHRPPQPRNP